MARPVKFTRARRDLVLQALREGLTRTAAAGEAGIHRETLRATIESDLAFSAEVDAAEDEAEAYMIRRAMQGRGSDVPKEDAWRWLETRRRGEWGKNQKVTTEGTVETRITFAYDDGPDPNAG